MAPSSSNWADDDDDEFDLDIWKANVDASTPTASELGPLQRVLSEDEEDVALTTESAPFAEVETADTDKTPSPAGPSPRDPAIIAIEVELARNTVLRHALDDDSDAPAYPEMSHYSCLTPSPMERVSYTSNWNHFKAGNGFDCRRNFLFRSSRLREVTSFDHVEDVAAPDLDDTEALTGFSEIDLEDMPSAASSAETIDTWERSDSGSDANDSKAENTHPVVQLPSRPFSLNHIIHGVVAEASADDAEFAFEDVLEDEHAPDACDEGYHTATPAASPTEERVCDKLTPTSRTTVLNGRPAVAYTRRDCVDRGDSLDALVAFRGEFSNGDAVKEVFDEDDDDDNNNGESLSAITDTEIDIINDEPLEATDLSRTPTSATWSSQKTDVLPAYIDSPMSTKISKGFVSAAFTKGRYYASFIPGVSTIVSSVHTLFGRMRAYLHQC